MRDDTKSYLSGETGSRKTSSHNRPEISLVSGLSAERNPVTDILFAIEGLSWMPLHEFFKLKHDEMTTHIAFIRDDYI